MAIKEVFQEITNTDNYEAELSRILAIGCVEHSVLFYHYASYYYHVLKKPFISKDSFKDLCDFIYDTQEAIPTTTRSYINLEDVGNYTCKLVEAPMAALHKKGVHFIPNLLSLLRDREETFDIAYAVEVWGEGDVSSN